MPSILVVEQEPHYVERINAALSAEGWHVRVVPGVDQALQAAAADAPDLVMAGTDVPGFAVLAFSFSREAGGPGLLGLAPAEPADPADSANGQDRADGRLVKPFTDQQVVLAARQALLARRQNAAATPVKDQKLTSHDIFGDVLAEVEEDGVPPAPAPRPAAPVAAAPKPAPAHDDEVQRRLEKTLSGVLGPEPRPRPAAAPTAPPRRAETGVGDVDALLSKTLSNLELGRTKTGVRPPVAPAPPQAVPAAPAAAAAPRPAPAPPAAPAPATPPPAAAPPARPTPPAIPAQEGTAVRKRVGDFDFSELEELARPTRPGPAAGTSAPARPAAPAPPRPAPPKPEPLPFTPQPVPAPVGASVRAPSAVPAVPAVPADIAATQRIPVFTEEPGDQAGERFGQYTLLERIAVGGMAEVWKARMRGVEGFQKTVAIKRILPHMTDNAEFVGMFIDEAKLAAQLTHPNIVHIYDLGKIGRDYYIAMEYVDGKDLRSLLNAARRKGTPLPLGLGLLIAARVASALDYAHRKRDFEDREMGLVHRDVSPQNVLLTSEGDVKLCDFGIAKAVSKASQTQMGALKGKLQYMSPEQAWGRAVDSRSDLFSLGAVLFEMVTGERQFPGDSEMSVLESVRQGRVRTPRQVDPSIPHEVDEIVARALAVDPQDRFQSAGEMKQRLEAVLASLAPSLGPTDLSAYIRRVLEPEPERIEPAVPPAPAAPATDAWTPEPDAASDGPAMPAMSGMPVMSAMSATSGTSAAPTPMPDGPAPQFEAVAPLVRDVTVEEESGRKSRTLLYAAIAAAVVIAILTFFFLHGRRDASPAAPPAGAATPQTPGAPLPSANPAAAALGAAAPDGRTAPAPAAKSAAGMPSDLQAIVDQQLAAKEEEMRRKNEEKLKDLEKQLAASKTAGQPAAPGSSAVPVQQAPAPAPAETTSEPAPRQAAPEPAPAPEPQREPEPAKAEEKPPAPEPARAKEPDPAAAPRKAGEEGSGVTVPQLVSFPKPEYPPMARNLRVEGIVVVAVLVDENGQVQDARVEEPIRQNVGLNEAALRSARSARYRPATKDGARVKMWTRLRIPFKL
ncbi:MAG TPA: TonB family protein [Thermoanaerobaculia bacterium]|jgi:TonB family protein|nr:TonB family protein [Thermoanaerobaculia bacterium]